MEIRTQPINITKDQEHQITRTAEEFHREYIEGCAKSSSSNFMQAAMMGRQLTCLLEAVGLIDPLKFHQLKREIIKNEKAA